MKTLFWFLLATAASAQTINPNSQITWPRVSGTGAPTGVITCPASSNTPTTATVGTPYTDIAGPHYWQCGTAGWFQVDGAGGSTTSFKLNGTLLGGDFATNPQIYDYDSTTPVADAGYINATGRFVTASGKWNVEVPAFQIQPLIQLPDDTHQYYIIYPTVCTHNDTGFGRILSTVSCPGSSPGSATFQQQFLNTSFPPTTSTVTFSGWSLPASIPAGNVTGVYAAAYSSTDGFGNNFSSRTCSGVDVLPTTTTWLGTQVTSLTGLTGATIGSAACSLVAVNSSSQPGPSTTNVDAVVLIVQYTGTVVPQPSYLNVEWPLSLNTSTNTLGIDLSFPGWTNAITVAQFNQLSSVTRNTTLGYYAMVDISDGSTPTDCSVGGGSNRVKCYFNGTAWVAWNPGGGGSGITALTGDVTATGPGSATATLATVNSSPGTCGDATHVCQVTTNGKGLTTAQTQVAITGGGGVSGQAINVIGKATNATTTGAQSALSDDGTTVTSTEPVSIAVAGGQGGTVDLTEGTGPGAAAGHDILYADSTAHCIKQALNGGSFACLGTGSGGLTSLNSQTGPSVTLQSSGATVAITTPSSNVINLEATGGGGGTIPSNALFVFACTSGCDDDHQILSPQITVSSYSQTGTVVSFVNTGTNNFKAGDWISTRFTTGWAPNLPSGLALGTGHTLFQVLSSGLSATTFQIDVGSLPAQTTCPSSCGTVESAMSFNPFVMAKSASFPSGALANVHVLIPAPVTVPGMSSTYATNYHPLSPAVNGAPAYLIIMDHDNDDDLCTAPATVQGAYQTLFAAAHADNYTVVAGSGVGYNFNQVTGCSTAYLKYNSNRKWLLSQGRNQSNIITGQFWDIFVDTATATLDGTDANMPSWGPDGQIAVGNAVASAIASGGSPATWNPYFWGAFQGGNNQGIRWAPYNDEAGQQFIVSNVAGDDMFKLDSSGNAFVQNTLHVNFPGICPDFRQGCIGGPFYIGGSLKVTGPAASSGQACLHIDTAGNITNTGADCATTSSVNVNGSPVSAPNFNGTTPSVAATAGVNNVYQVSSSNVSSYTPVATGSTPGVIKPDGTTCTVSSGTLTCTGSSGATSLPICTDSSGSPSAYTCTTSPSFTPVAGSVIAFKPGISNTGNATLNVNSTSAASIAKWQNTTILAANDLRSGTYTILTYDGTNWEAQTIGNAPSGGGTPASQVIQTISVSTTGISDLAFTSIPQTFHNLRLNCTGQSHISTPSDDVLFIFNGDTSSHYVFSRLDFGNLSPQNDNNTNAAFALAGRMAAVGAGTSRVTSIEAFIPGYTNTTSTNKEWFANTNGPNASIATSSQVPFSQIVRGWYIATSAGAITQIDVKTNSTDYFMPNITSCTLIGEL